MGIAVIFTVVFSPDPADVSCDPSPVLLIVSKIDRCGINDMCPVVGNVWLTGCDHRLRSGGTYGDIAAAGCCATVCEDVANHVTTVAQHFNYSGCISVLLY